MLKKTIVGFVKCYMPNDPVEFFGGFIKKKGLKKSQQNQKANDAVDVLNCYVKISDDSLNTTSGVRMLKTDLKYLDSILNEESK